MFTASYNRLSMHGQERYTFYLTLKRKYKIVTIKQTGIWCAVWQRVDTNYNMRQTEQRHKIPDNRKENITAMSKTSIWKCTYKDLSCSHQLC